MDAGFDVADSEYFALAASELATNLVKYSENGCLVIRELHTETRRGLELESTDDGPGIRDLEAAVTDGYSTTNSLGSGLPGVQRMTDEFRVDTGSHGTRIVARKWLRAK